MLLVPCAGAQRRECNEALGGLARPRPRNPARKRGSGPFLPRSSVPNGPRDGWPTHPAQARRRGWAGRARRGRKTRRGRCGAGKKQARPEPGLGRDAESPWHSAMWSFTKSRVCRTSGVRRPCTGDDPDRSPEGGRPGIPGRRGDHTCKSVVFVTPVARARSDRRAYQLNRGPTNHWASPSANFTSPLRPQFWLNFTFAPRRP